MSSFEAEHKQEVIEGPYYTSDHLYASFGCAVFSLLGLIVLGVALLLTFVFLGSKKAAADATPNHIRQSTVMANYTVKVAQAKRKLALERVKQSHITSFKAEISAYTAIETCHDRCIMANGQKAYYGAVACPRRIPLGTMINIDGLGVFTCADRTATWVDGRFDVFFGYSQADHTRAINFGSPWRLVTINNNL